MSYVHSCQLSSLTFSLKWAWTSKCSGFHPLPLKAPDTKIYLWLSTKIASWQFIGRHLGLDEADLERIRADHGGGGTDEQCYQMLLRWRMTSGRDECTYRRLGQVLRDSNKNKHLYAEYVERVRAVEKLQ